MSDALRRQARTSACVVIRCGPDQALVLADALEIAGVASKPDEYGGIEISLPPIAPAPEPEVLAYRRMRARPKRPSLWAWIKGRAG